MRFLRQSLTGLFLASLTLGLLVHAAQMIRGAVEARMAEERTAPPARERIFAVGVQRAEAGREIPILEAYGEIRARRTLELRAAASGRVLQMAEAFVEGGEVTQGDVLVRIDPVDAEAARDRVAADLADAEAEVRDADTALAIARDDLAASRDQAELQTRALERQRDLEARGVGTTATVETAELAEAAARQTVLARRQAVAQAEARVAQAVTSFASTRHSSVSFNRRVGTFHASPISPTL